MSLWSALSPVLQRYLVVSLACLLADAAAFEVLFSALGWQAHLARLATLCLATGLFHAVCAKFVFPDGKPPETRKGQPLPAGVLAIAGAALSFTIFTRLLPLVPDETAGRIIAVAAGGLAAAACNFFLLHSMLPQKGETAKIGLRPRTLWSLIVWSLFLLVALTSSAAMEHLRAVLAFPALELPLGPPGPDSWLRLTQVRQWLTGTDFFNHAVTATNAPLGGIETPWTRPMDSLVALFYFLTPAKHGVDLRLLISATWLPLFLGVGAIWLSARTARLHFNSIHALAIAVMVFFVSPYDILTPGDADHHVFLLLLWSACVCIFLSNDNSSLRGLALGAVSGLMIWTSPEALVFCGLVFALMGIDAVYAPEKAVRLLTAALGSAVVVMAGLYVEKPAGVALSNIAYDTLSIVHATLMGLTLFGTAVMATVFRYGPSLKARWFIALACGGAVFLAQFLLYPKFYNGPLADIDISVLPDLLSRVKEAQPLFSGAAALTMRIIAMPLLAAFLLGACLMQKKARPAKTRFLVFSALLLAGSFAMTFLQVRWGYYLQPVSAFIIGALLPGYAGAGNSEEGSWLKTLSRKWRPYLVIWGVYLLFVLTGKSLAGVTPPPRFCLPQLDYVIQTGQLVKLLGDEELTVFVPPDAGGQILFFTPYRIIASNYHREFTGLRDVARIETATTDDEAKSALEKRKVNALLFCAGSYPHQSWLHRTKNALPKWLESVDGLDFMDLDGERPLLLRVRD